MSNSIPKCIIGGILSLFGFSLFMATKKDDRSEHKISAYTDISLCDINTNVILHDVSVNFKKLFYIKYTGLNCMKEKGYKVKSYNVEEVIKNKFSVNILNLNRKMTDDEKEECKTSIFTEKEIFIKDCKECNVYLEVLYSNEKMKKNELKFERFKFDENSFK
jgi:hypothetical protein